MTPEAFHHEDDCIFFIDMPDGRRVKVDAAGYLAMVEQGTVTGDDALVKFCLEIVGNPIQFEQDMYEIYRGIEHSNGSLLQ